MPVFKEFARDDARSNHKSSRSHPRKSVSAIEMDSRAEQVARGDLPKRMCVLRLRQRKVITIDEQGGNNDQFGETGFC